MKTFEALFIHQFLSVGKYEVEIEKKQNGELVSVWDTEDKTFQHFEFDNEGNLVDMY